MCIRKPEPEPETRFWIFQTRKPGFGNPSRITTGLAAVANAVTRPRNNADHSGHVKPHNNDHDDHYDDDAVAPVL